MLNFNTPDTTGKTSFVNTTKTCTVDKTVYPVASFTGNTSKDMYDFQKNKTGLNLTDNGWSYIY